MADKVVTRAEYEESLDVTRRCLEGIAGVTQVTVAERDGHTEVGFEHGESGDRADEIQRSTDACAAETDGVQWVHQMQSRPTGSDLRAAQSQLVACAGRAGVQVPSGAQVEDVLRALAGAAAQGGDGAGQSAQQAAAAACIDEYNGAAKNVPDGLAEALAGLDV